jgi:hypothetical protein
MRSIPLQPAITPPTRGAALDDFEFEFEFESPLAAGAARPAPPSVPPVGSGAGGNDVGAGLLGSGPGIICVMEPLGLSEDEEIVD